MFNLRTIVLFVVVTLATGSLFAQVLPLGCQSEFDAIVDFDRKDFACNPADKSQAYMLDFTIPPAPADCKVITSIDFSISFGDNITVPMGCFVGWFTNVFVNCNGFGICDCSDTGVDNLYGNFGVPPSLNVPNASNHIQWGDVISFDLVAVINLDPALTCSMYKDAITDGLATANFTICVDINYADDIIDMVPDLGPDYGVCFGETTDIDLPGFSMYAWDPGGQTTQCIKSVGADTYTVTVTDSKGCTATDQITIDENPMLSVTFDRTDPFLICSHEIVDITATASGGSGSGYMYQWNTPGGNSSTNPNVTTDIPGMYNVTVTDDAMCSTTSSISMSFHPDPIASVNAPLGTIYCSNTPLDLEGVASAGSGGPYMFDWSGPNGYTSADQNITITEQGTYNLIVMDANGCFSAPFPILVTEVLASNPGVNNVLDVCNNNTSVDLDVLLGTHDAGSWWDIDGAGVTISDGTNIDFSSVLPGIYQFEHRVIGISPCLDDFATITVTVAQAKYAGFDNNLSLCSTDSPVDFYGAIGATDFSGVWSDVNLSGVSFATPNAIDITMLATGTYNYEYIVDADQPCNDAIARLELYVEQAPFAGRDTSGITVCTGSTIDMLDYYNPLPQSNGVWSDVLSKGLDLSDPSNVDLLGLGTGLFIVEYCVTGTVCTGQICSTVEFNITELDAGNAPDTSLCEGLINLDLFTYAAAQGNGVFLGTQSDTFQNGMIDSIGILGDSIEVVYQLEAIGACPASTDTFYFFFDSEEESRMIQESYCDDNQMIVQVGTDTYDINNPIGVTVLQTEEGCDSIINVELNFNLSTNALIEEEYCTGDGFSITIGTDVYNEANPIGTTIIPNSANCDSVVDVNLIFLNVITGEENSMHCKGDGYSVTIGGVTFDETNPTGSATLVSSMGCDSVVSVNLDFVDAISGTLSTDHCSGDGYSITIGNTTFDESNPTGNATILSSAGCDSIVDVSLNFVTVPDGNVQSQHCSGDGFSVTIGSTTFDENNPIGTSTILSSAGCDSTVVVMLDFLMVLTGEENSSHCIGDGYSITIGNTTFDENNPTGNATIASSLGCDSIVTVQLQFLNNLTNEINSQHCTGDGYSIMVGNMVFDETNPSGQVTLNSASNCDSIVSVNLEFNATLSGMESSTHCQGDGYIFDGNGQIFDEANPNGSFTISSASGCDSIVEVMLLFLPNSSEDIIETRCQGDNYEIIVGTDIYNESNPSGQTMLINAQGCDSIVTVDLDYSGTQINTDIMTDHCQGDGYELIVGSDTYNESRPSGMTLFTSSIGCDSVVNVNLNFAPPGMNAIQDILCEDESIVIGNETITIDNNPTQIILPAAASNGCDSIIDVDIAFDPNQTEDFNLQLCEGDSIFLEGNWQFTAGTYIDTYAAANGCDSTVTNNVSMVFCGITYDISSENLNCFESQDGSIDIIISDGMNLPYQINLNLDGVNVETATLNSLSDLISFNTLVAGNYELIVLDASGQQILQEDVLITEPAELVVSELVSLNPSCPQEMDGMIEIDIIGGTGAYTIEWSNGAMDNTMLSQLTANTYDVLVTDLNLCSTPFSITLTDPELITADIEVFDIVCSAGIPGAIEVINVANGTPPYSYSIDNINFGQEAYIDGLIAGSYDVYLSDANGCTIVLEDIIIQEQNDLDISIDDLEDVELGEIIILDPQLNFVPDNIVWTPAEGLSCTDCLNPELAVGFNQTYTITASLISGCSTFATFNVKTEEVNVYIPNAFSPNSDGINDGFIIQTNNPENVTIDLDIYDRWGNRVFGCVGLNPTDPMAIWSGKGPNNNFLPGVYVYRLIVDDGINQRLPLNGEVLLIH